MEQCLILFGKFHLYVLILLSCTEIILKLVFIIRYLSGLNNQTNKTNNTRSQSPSQGLPPKYLIDVHFSITLLIEQILFIPRKCETKLFLNIGNLLFVPLALVSSRIPF